MIIMLMIVGTWFPLGLLFFSSLFLFLRYSLFQANLSLKQKSLDKDVQSAL